MGNEHGKLPVATPAGIQSMDESLQRKFAKGIQYNMKIIIRGDRNTGKTCLFHRMEGRPFSEAYIPTEEIQVLVFSGAIKSLGLSLVAPMYMWFLSPVVTNDTVKVEIWDIVDKGRPQKKGGKGILKMFNSPSDQKDEAADAPLDAEFLDVYKGAHGVVFIFDMTKQWTWRYVERELEKVPLHIPIIVMANFRDMGEHRVVGKDECIMFIEQLNRPEGSAEVRYGEVSLKNTFGLMHLHKFLSVPFLQLQEETLLNQLQVNREQMLAAREELDLATKTEDQNYGIFRAKMEKAAEEKRRKAQQEQEAMLEGSDSPASPIRREVLESQQAKPPSPKSAEPPQRSGSLTSKLSSRFSGMLSKHKEEGKKTELQPVPQRSAKKPPSDANIDDFVPEGEVDSFLESGEGEDETDGEAETDSDDESGNALVAMDEDLSSPEEEPLVPAVTKQPEPLKPKAPSRPPVTLKSPKDVVLTESEGEESPEEESRKKEVSSTKKKKQQQELLDIFTKEPSETPQKESGGLKISAETRPKKSGGLMIEFKQEQPKKAKEPKDSPDFGEEKRERKKKKSKKSKSRETTTTEKAPAVRSEDLFGLTSSLDAWLNAEPESNTAGLGKVLEPIQANSEGFGDNEETEEERTTHKKSKKHRHKRRDSSEGKKKHGHRSRQSHDSGQRQNLLN